MGEVNLKVLELNVRLTEFILHERHKVGASYEELVQALEETAVSARSFLLYPLEALKV